LPVDTCSINSSSTKTFNAWSMGDQENLGGYIDTNLTTWAKEYSKSENKTYTNNMALYLLQKIGYIDSNDKVHGMCASVFKQCQDYTFSTKGTRKSYIPANEVVRQYLNNTLAKIKVQQDAIIADYAEDCRNDVTSCLAMNGYDESATNSTATKTAINACAAEITTCMSVGGYQITDGVKLTLRAMSDWVASIMLTCPENQYLSDDGVGHVSCKACPVVTPIVYTEITNIANTENFYDLIYPDNPNYARVQFIIDEDLADETLSKRPQYVQMTSAGGRATSCSCPSGYTLYLVNGTSGGILGTDWNNALNIMDVSGETYHYTCIDNSIRCYNTFDETTGGENETLKCESR
ncbi:MAG: hypothetical protein II843_03955, partial [Alphaproteobacteria bacterium]|nr:hypothetical protein [Alphaproteobacteria bacterium]